MNLAVVTSKLAVAGGPKVQLAVAKIGKYSPQILTAVGIGGGVTSTFLIAKASTKLEPVLDEHENRKAIVRIKLDEDEYSSEQEYKKALTGAHVKTAFELTKLYGPGVSIGVGSILCVVAAQGISHKRQVALVAAIKSAESAFQAYRARVTEAIGEDKEADIRYGVSTETVEGEDGKKTKVKVYNPSALSGYTRMFDESNRNWQRGNKELNFLFLKNMQNWANDRLDSRGYLYLNEVLSWLNFPEVPEGQIIGWLHKDVGNGDGYVDFGWDNPINNQVNRDFLAGVTDGILLDFNCDGEINSKL